MSIVTCTGQCCQPTCQPLATPFVARMSSPCRNHSTTCDWIRNLGERSPATHG